MFRRTPLVFVFSFFAWNLYGSWAQTEVARHIVTFNWYSQDELGTEGTPDKLPVSENFKLIGSRLFYIEKENALDWFAAANMCYQMGGRLATIQSKEELLLIVPKLNWNSAYWLDLNDLSEEGRFVSSASDEPAPFLKWRKGQPDNYNQNGHCVQLINYYMYDCSCLAKRYFICEA